MTATTATATITTFTNNSTGFLNSVLADLQVEASQARTTQAYQATKVQVDRVRAALAARGAL
jgi:hypothetical protein